MADINNSRMCVARKDHICTICSRVIPKGTRYWYNNELESGEWITYKAHQDCEIQYIEEVDMETDLMEWAEERMRAELYIV